MSEPAADGERVVDEIRAHYATAAVAAGRAATQTSCCGAGGSHDPRFGAALYDPGEQAELPSAAVLASLGCGNPTAVAELQEGETVLDLGSGGGIDVLLSARRVGVNGKAIGLDMTDEMLELARRNAAEAGIDNVEFLRGHIEAIPLPDDSVDVIISNCVINLSVDKARVMAEMHRVLAPGGRIGVADIIAGDDLTVEERRQRGTHAECIAGALSSSEYRAGLATAGFVSSEIAFTHEVAEGMHGAIIRAVKPYEVASSV